jgi:TRAP-type uncharacterized transport system substrate-binding protein
MAVRDILRHNWPAITIAVTGAAIAIAALVLLRGMPPSVIVMATGSEGSDYQAAAERYRAALASAGVEVRLKPSAGALENRDLLFDPRSGVSVALIAGGSLSAGDASQLESLGTMFYEPLWLFHKADPRDVIRDGQRGRLTRDDLHGRKISIGPEGSATRALSLKLLERNRIEPQEVELLPLPPQAAGEKLLAGDIDVAVMLSSWDAPIVQKLLGDERVVLATFARADAYVALYPFLNKVTVPRGVGDLAKDLPPTDVVLFAPKASLVVRKDLHPAIQYLLLEAAAQIHSGPGVFHRANEFPAAEVVDIPLSSEAQRFYRSGPPFLHNYLPFWMASLVGKLAILLIPILGVLYPMMRFLPRLYDWIMRSRVLRMYGELRLLEDEMTAARSSGRDTRDMITRLDRLEYQANQLRVPVAYASMLYMLRNHIDLVREGSNKHAAKAAE